MFGSNSGTAFGAKPAGSVFGGGNTANPSPFGAPANNNNTGSTGLFGAKPASSGGLFSSTGSAGSSGSSGMFGSNTFGGLNNNNTAATNNNSTTGTGFGFGTNAGSGTTGGLFGGASNTVNTGSSGGLFGAKPASTGTTGGLFGGNNTTTAGNTTGGLFGGNSGATNTSGGLFGGNNTTGASNTGFGASNNTSGGLFGAKPAGAATTQTTGGLFGNSSASQPASTGGLFGAKPAGADSAGGLFGNTSTSTAPSTGGLFGNNNSAATSGSTIGGGLFGNQQQIQQQQQQQQQQHQFLITPLTTIGDLPEVYKNEISQLDNFIQNQVQIAEKLKTEQEEHSEVIESIPRDIEYLENKYSFTNQALDDDLKVLGKIRESTDEALTDSENFFIILQRLLNGYNKISSVELDKFLNKKLAQYKLKLEEYQQTLLEIDSAVDGIEKDSVSDINGLNLIITTIHEEFNLFKQVSQTVAEIHQKVKLLDNRAEGRI